MRLPGAVAVLLSMPLWIDPPTHPVARAAGASHAPGRTGPAEDPVLIIRSDDGGMSHAVNMALERLMNSGMPVSVSVMFACPWYQETVEILKRHPAVAVGVHLTLNSEWKNYRWGPVAGRNAVPSLVDADGYFFPSGEAFLANHPRLPEIEIELRAQLDRARRSGLKIDYVDYHMLTLLRTPEMRALVERLAHEYGLGMSEYFGEVRTNPQYDAAPAAKTDSLVALAARLRPGATLLVTHTGIDGPELGALLDMNTEGGLARMSQNRQAELDAVLSRRFRDALRRRNVRLLTYRDIIASQGLQSMRRPQVPVPELK